MNSFSGPLTSGTFRETGPRDRGFAEDGRPSGEQYQTCACPLIRSQHVTNWATANVRTICVGASELTNAGIFCTFIDICGFNHKSNMLRMQQPDELVSISLLGFNKRLGIEASLYVIHLYLER